VVAQNPQDTVVRADGPKDQIHPRVDAVTGAVDLEAVVAGHHANIDRETADDLGDSLRQTVDAINVEIRQV
jgi:hypothetical protein